jgi:tetratricopeptide (TPR) repeat protein
VLFKLARLKEALADLNRAIELTEQERDQFEQALQGRRLSRSDVAAKAEQERQFDENLAVMHHHRGEVHEKLGHADEAKKDLFIAQELGFNPAAGVY